MKREMPEGISLFVFCVFRFFLLCEIARVSFWRNGAIALSKKFQKLVRNEKTECAPTAHRPEAVHRYASRFRFVGAVQFLEFGKFSKTCTERTNGSGADTARFPDGVQ